MDFLRRGTNDQPQAVRSNGVVHNPAVSSVGETTSRKHGSHDSQPASWARVAFVVLFASLAVLALAVASLFYFSKNSEVGMVDGKKSQAVFLTNGQVYFGKIKGLNSQYVDLQDIYYLNSQSDSEDSKATPNLSLVKLGCELHGPQDRMVINRDQVSFWENLNADGKVAKAIDQWKNENPDGQKCVDTSNSTQQSSGTPTGTTAPTNP